MTRSPMKLAKFTILGLFGLTLAATFQNCNGYRNDAGTTSSSTLSLASAGSDLMPIYIYGMGDEDAQLRLRPYVGVENKLGSHLYNLSTRSSNPNTGPAKYQATTFFTYTSPADNRIELRDLFLTDSGDYSGRIFRNAARLDAPAAEQFGYLTNSSTSASTVPVYACIEYDADGSGGSTLIRWTSPGGCGEPPVTSAQDSGAPGLNNDYDGVIPYNGSFKRLVFKKLLGYALPADTNLNQSPPAQAPAPQVSNIDTQITGNIDQVTTEGNQSIVRGWACSTGMKDQVWVHVYAGSDSDNKFIGAAQANLPSEPAVATACGDRTNTNHRFAFSVDANKAAQFARQQIYVFGISPAGKSNNKLSQSGSFKLPPASNSVNAALEWSTAGPIRGRACVKIFEPAEPANHTWDDNFLCSTQDYGFNYSHAGITPELKNMVCVQLLETSDPHTWTDNFLCTPKDIGLKFNSAGPIPGMRCTSMNETSDPDSWSDNYVCLP